MLKPSSKTEIVLKKEEYVASHFLEDSHVCLSDNADFLEQITKVLLLYRGLERTLFRQDIETTYEITIPPV